MNEVLVQLRDHWSDAVAVVLALIAILQSYRANRFSRQLAQHEGAFDKPELKVGLFGTHEVKRFIILAPITPAPLLFPMSFSVSNLGAATAEDVQLLLRANENLLPYSREWLEKEQPDPSGLVKASFYAKEGHVNSVMYRIAHLHPGMPLNLVNTTILDRSTLLQAEAPVKTKDGKQGMVSYTVAFEYRLELVAFRKDGAPLAAVFQVSVFDTAKQSEAEALESYWRRRSSSMATPTTRRWWKRSPSKIERIRVVTVDPASIQSAKDIKRRHREAPLRALKAADGALAPDGLFVPALAVAFGSFDGALPRKVPEQVPVAPDDQTGPPITGSRL